MPFTPAYIAPPAKEKPTYRFSWVRVVAVGVLLTLLLAVCLYLNHTAIKAMATGLADGEHKNSAWIAEELGNLLPLIVVALFQFCIYYKHDNHNGIAQKEMAWEILVCTLLTYAVLLPYVMHMSDTQLAQQLADGVKVEKNEGGRYITLFLNSVVWFLRVGVTLLLLWLFHTVKAHSEEKYPPVQTPETPETTIETTVETTEVVQEVETPDATQATHTNQA